MKEIGKMGWDMDMESLSIEMGLSIKENGKEAWNGEKEKWLMLQEIILKENGRIIREMVKEPCIGLPQMRSIQEIGTITSKVGLEPIYG